MSSINLKEIRVVYHSSKSAERIALDSFSLQADREMLALLGPNGAGKSTLLNVISQSIIPGSGEVITPSSRESVSIVFQTPALDELLTIRENLMVAGALHNLPKNEINQRVEDIANELGISDRLNDQVRHLSGGLIRRADLARALIPHPSVLLLDEPTTGLDIDARRGFWETIDRTRKQYGMTVILATHLTEEADHADRVVMIRDGKKIIDDSPNALKTTFGDRIIRVNVKSDSDADDVCRWLSQNNIEYLSLGHLIIGKNADAAFASSCPIGSAEITIAPPALSDVYTFYAQSVVSESDSGVLS
ncbi:MAG: ABC transporter ATP-binding protein [Phycisphaerales bacterium]|nr:ABC transporter ATP-binding protein [Phycisphaerales bacterium]